MWKTRLYTLIAAALSWLPSACGRAEAPAKTFAAPESFRTSLAAVFDGYVIVSNALADGQIVLAMNAASAMDTVRAIFAAYSPILDSAFRTFELEARVPIVALICPKALGGKGAIWMQRDAVPVNPYLGRADGSCADPMPGKSGS